MAEPRIRDAQARDLDALYDICLKTGDSGADATHLHRDRKLVGHIYAAPYLILAPELAMVVEDDEGVAAYIVGALDTLAFDARLEAEWWPALRQSYAEPMGEFASWNLDELRAWLIHHPQAAPARIVGPYPSHLHINLLPRLQGRGFGKALMDAWLARAAAMGSRGMHLGVSTGNARGLKFYRAYGLEQFRFPSERPDAGAIYFVRSF